MLYTGKPSSETLDYLLKRRSAKMGCLASPGPNADQLQVILEAAMRVPDHGRMVPWYFITFEGEARAQVGQVIAEIFARENPDAQAAKIEAERNRFMRAPVVVALVSRMRKGKKPLWEQILSAGAAGMNLSLAAHASGFGAVWVSEWYSFHDEFKSAIGLDARDHIAGLFFIGTPSEFPEERKRPDPSLIVNSFVLGQPLNKGDEYDQEKMGYPEAGFDLSVTASK